MLFIRRSARLRARSTPIRISPPIFLQPSVSATQGLVEDPGYAAGLLGAFGSALIDRTGPRPAARQVDGMGREVAIHHPRDLPAIPNNAILRQLGWCANTLQGVGAAAARHPEEFADMRARSRRFRRALDLVAHGLAYSELEVLLAILGTLPLKSGSTAPPKRFGRGAERLSLLLPERWSSSTYGRRCSQCSVAFRPII